MEGLVHIFYYCSGKENRSSCVGAARKVSPDWSQKTMTCHSFNCFSTVWGREEAPLVTSLPRGRSLYRGPRYIEVR